MFVQQCTYPESADSDGTSVVLIELTVDYEDMREDMEEYRSNMQQPLNLCFNILKETYFQSLELSLSVRMLELFW